MSEPQDAEMALTPDPDEYTLIPDPLSTAADRPTRNNAHEFIEDEEGDMKRVLPSSDPNIITIATFARVSDCYEDGFGLVLIASSAVVTYPLLKLKYAFEHASPADQDAYRELFGEGCEAMLYVTDVDHYNEVDLFVDWVNGVIINDWSHVGPSFITAWAFADGIHARVFQNLILKLFVEYFQKGPEGTGLETTDVHSIYELTEPGSQLRKLAIDVFVAGHLGENAEGWVAMLTTGAKGKAGQDCPPEFMRDVCLKIVQVSLENTSGKKEWSIEAEDYDV